MVDYIVYTQLRVMIKLVAFTIVTEKLDLLSRLQHLIFNCHTPKVLVHLCRVLIDRN